MIDAQDDRREAPRYRMLRGCKVLNPRTGRYTAGSTCDISDGGALVRLDRDPGVEIGDRLYLGVAQRRHQSVLIASEMAEMEVARRLVLSTGETALGLRTVSGDTARVERWAA